MIVGFTGSAGWKHFTKNRKPPLFCFVSTSSHTYDLRLRPNASFGLEYNLSKRVQINIGGMGGILWDGSSADAGVFPFVV